MAAKWQISIVMLNSPMMSGMSVEGKGKGVSDVVKKGSDGALWSIEDSHLEVGETVNVERVFLKRKEGKGQ